MKKFHKADVILKRERKWESYSVNLNLFKSEAQVIDRFFEQYHTKSLHMDFFLNTAEENEEVYRQTFDPERYSSLIDSVTLPLLYTEVTDPDLIKKYLMVAAALVAPHGTVYIPNYGNLDGALLGDIFLKADTIGTKTIKLTRCSRPRKFDLDMPVLQEAIQDLGIQEDPEEFINRPRLLPHQVEAFAFWDRINRRGLWALDMGTGKSFTQRYMLYKNMFSGTYQNIMVMTLASIVPAWKYEMERLGIPYLHWTGKKGYDQMQENVVNIMSIESVGFERLPENMSKLDMKRWKAKPFLQKLNKTFHRGMFDLIIVDESHKLNSPSNFATKLLNLITTPRTHLLFSTGTPFSNGLHEAFSQVNLLKPGALGKNVTWFYDNMCENVSKSKNYVKHRLRPHLKEQVTNIIYSVAKFQKIVEGVTLPPLTITDVSYNLSEEQGKFQKSIKDDLVIPVTTDKLQNGVPITTAARLGITLKTLCSGFISFDFQFPGLPVVEKVDKVFTENPKLEALMNLVEQIEDKQALIWIDSIRTGEMVTKHLSSLGYTVELINSSVSKAKRRTIISKFLDNKLQFIVAHPKTLGTGLDLINATYQIFYEMTYSLTEAEQAKKRSHRIGQKNHVVIYRLVGKGTIEKAVAYALDKKLDVEEYLFTEYLKQFSDRLQFEEQEETHVNTETARSDFGEELDY